MQETVHAYVRRLRQARGAWLSQRRLARLAGLAPSTIFRLEAGQHPPTAETLKAIAPHLGTSADDLLGRAGYRNVRDEAVAPSTVDPSVADPLVTLRAALDSGPWPEHISTAVFALLAAYAAQHRPLPDVDAPSLPATATATTETIISRRRSAPDRTDPAPQ